ncbi:MAG: DNA methylase N-4 [Patescibacteria group bacterium]|nr:MAG: DNA methylase N-4 [Patescibacteria group bacterium]
MNNHAQKINKKIEVDLAELLKSDAPYLIEDGKVNLEKLKGLLTGKTTEKEDDRFYFNWAGKDKVFQAIQAPAYSTLAPQKDKSIGWDETENLMIVGENLETLKLLLKPYFGKVKVIYIDPPYNTGKDFIYKDDFSSPLKDYLERTGQKGDDGTKLTTNSETNGRYHSDWLNFMYPRLFIARNLLKEDGVIFISIDDNEEHHLKMILDEIYGEDNLVGEFVVIRAEGGGLAKQYVKGHDYVLAYCKDLNNFEPLKRKKDIRGKIVSKGGQDYWLEDDWLRKEFGKYGTCHYEEIEKCFGIEKKQEVDEKIKSGEYALVKKKNGLNAVARLRLVETDGSKFYSVLKHLSVDGNDDLTKLGLENVFDFPKPVSLIKQLVLGASFLTKNEEDIILDFFAGSGTTGQAVYELNKEDAGNRRFILVQLDEAVDETKESGKNAKQMGLNTVAEICVERLKRVSESNEKKLKYKVFKLSPSNFNLKEEFELNENKDLGELKTNYLKELGLYVDQPTVATANTLDIVYEIILKNGFSLNSKIDEIKLGSNNFYKVSDTENELEIHISLDAKIEDNSVEAIRTTEYMGKTFVFYDNALNDSQKINLNTFVKLQVI